jgi:hypothetical protein
MLWQKERLLNVAVERANSGSGTRMEDYFRSRREDDIDGP